MSTYETIDLVIQGIIAVAASLVFYQIYLSKENSQQISKRESIRYSAELIEFFRKEILEPSSALDEEEKVLNFEKLDKEEKLIFRDFRFDEIKKLGPETHKKLIKNLNIVNSNVDSAKKRGNILNILESFSCPYIARVADEQTAFPVVGRAFCSIVQDNILLYLAVRNEEDDQDQFQGTVDLYKIWIERISLKKLESAEEALRKAISEIDSKEIVPIGVKR